MRQPINNSSRVPAYQNGEKSSVSATFRVASPFEGGLGGSTPLLVRFLGVSEKMNAEFCSLATSGMQEYVTDYHQN